MEIHSLGKLWNDYINFFSIKSIYNAMYSYEFSPYIQQIGWIVDWMPKEHTVELINDGLDWSRRYKDDKYDYLPHGILIAWVIWLSAYCCSIRLSISSNSKSYVNKKELSNAHFIFRSLLDDVIKSFHGTRNGC